MPKQSRQKGLKYARVPYRTKINLLKKVIHDGYPLKDVLDL